MKREWLTTQELADELRVPLATIYKWREKGVGPRAIRVGKYIRFSREDVDQWCEEQADD